MKKKWKIIIPIILVLLIAAAGLFIWLNRGGSNSDEVAYVSEVRSVNYAQNTYSVNRFSGVVESQQTIDFKKDGNRDIEEIYVKEGDTVENGAALFKYDVRSSENNIAQSLLDIEGMNSELNIYRQNNSTENQILARQTEIAIQKKQAEIAAYQQEIDNAVVTSSLQGIVKKINEDGINEEGMEAPVVQVMEIGEYRVKGKIDEQLFGVINVGDPVVVRSRVDESLVWHGKVSKIETEPQNNNENNYFGGETGETASSYPFYISLDSTEGLMLGQHVLIEPASESSDLNLTGIWLISDYVIMEEDGPYIYVSENGRLKKRRIEIGAVNEELFITEIVSGLSEDDLITWPDETYSEGMPTVNMSEVRE